MKKSLLVAVLLGVLSLAHATTITNNAPSGLIGKNALNGKYAYLWTVPVASQDITSATITFTDVSGKGGKKNGINVDIGSFLGMSVGQSSVPTSGGLGSIIDKNASGDAFGANISADKAVNIGTKLFPSKKSTQTWSYTFTGAQLDALNSYIASGNWGFEIDPDGKFSVGGITFEYTSEIAGPTPVGVVATVPDSMATIGLLGASFFGLILMRRKLCLN